MESNKIPKIIHYCWFGNNPKPRVVTECIEGWKKTLTGYKIMEWSEKDFDIESNVFVKEAYRAKKYAFVSDYVRLYALYNFGGIYLDTDVKVFKAFDDLLNNELFWGFEEGNLIATSTIGAMPKNLFIKEFLDSYEHKTFKKPNGAYEMITNVDIVTKMLQTYDVKLNGEKQTIDGIGTIYPQEYFSPYDYINCRYRNTDNTYCMHLFYKSWLPIDVRIKGMLKKYLAMIIGGENIAKIREKLK